MKYRFKEKEKFIKGIDKLKDEMKGKYALYDIERIENDLLKLHDLIGTDSLIVQEENEFVITFSVGIEFLKINKLYLHYLVDKIKDDQLLLQF